MYMDAIRRAKVSIRIEQFLFTPDSVGKPIVDLLIKKATEGVSIKCMFDSMGSINLAQSEHVQRMTKAGIKVKFFNWIFPFSTHNKKIWYFRDHRRILIIDREVMMTGGLCIGKRMEDWRDTHIRVEGQVVSQATYIFDVSWSRIYKKRTMRLGGQYRTGTDRFSLITHAPLLRERYLYYRLIDAMRCAEKSIDITVPYFLPDRRIIRVLLLAKKRGVRVRILIPEVSDHRFVDYGSGTYFNQLLKKGIEIYRYKAMIHAKTVSIDNDWGLIGTLNFDNISLRYNFEIGLITTNRLCIQELNELFEQDTKNSNKLSFEGWQRRSLFTKFMELVVWPIRKFL